MIIHLVTVDVLPFFEVITPEPRYFSTKDTLSLVENISVMNSHQYNKDNLHFRENIRYSFANKHYTITDILNLKESIHTPKDLQQFFDVLELNEQITIIVGNNLNEELTFFESFSLRHFQPKHTITDSLQLHETIAFAKFKNNVSISSQTPSVVSTDCPVFISTYPYITFSGLGSINLNAPDKGNTDDLNLGRINRRSRGGDLILKRIPFRPRSNILKYTLHIYNRHDKDKVKEFFKRNWGQEIELIDHEGITYTGLLTNVPEFIEDLDCCYTVGLEILTLL